MVPLAWALRTAGHEVRVATQPEMAEAVTRTGLTAVPLGSDHRWKQVMEASQDEGWASRVAEAVTHSADLGHDELFRFFDETTTRYFRTVNNDEFTDALVAHARRWQPDLIVWEQFTWAGAVAARATGAAHARMLWGADVVTRSRNDFLDRLAERPEDRRTDPLRDWLTESLARHGAAYDETVANGQWTIDVSPPGHRVDNGLPVVGVRYIPYNGQAELPEWLAAEPARPRVAVTAGISVRGYFGFDMFSIGALQAFAGLDIELIATLLPAPGESADMAPDNATVVDFVPMQGPAADLFGRDPHRWGGRAVHRRLLRRPAADPARLLGHGRTRRPRRAVRRGHLAAAGPGHARERARVPRTAAGGSVVPHGRRGTAQGPALRALAQRRRPGPRGPHRPPQEHSLSSPRGAQPCTEQSSPRSTT
nr:nucleotide disphospho-sugar-binding domain-containing protein [Streptomyces sp. H-KF8]